MRVFAQALFPAALSLILAELTCFMVVTMEEICVPPPKEGLGAGGEGDDRG